MITGYIVCFSVFDHSAPASVGSAGPPMVTYLKIHEALGAPAQLVGLHFVQRIRARPDPQSAELIPALPAIDFGAAANMKGGVSFENLLAVLEMMQKPSGNTEPRSL